MAPHLVRTWSAYKDIRQGYAHFITHTHTHAQTPPPPPTHTHTQTHTCTRTYTHTHTQSELTLCVWQLAVILSKCLVYGDHAGWSCLLLFRLEDVKGLKPKIQVFEYFEGKPDDARKQRQQHQNRGKIDQLKQLVKYVLVTFQVLIFSLIPRCCYKKKYFFFFTRKCNSPQCSHHTWPGLWPVLRWFFKFENGKPE